MFTTYFKILLSPDDLMAFYALSQSPFDVLHNSMQ